jgi:hypothetical protein
VHIDGNNFKYLVQFYAIVKNPTTTQTIRLCILRRLGHVQRMEESRIPKRVLYMNLELTNQEVDQEINGRMN